MKPLVRVLGFFIGIVLFLSITVNNKTIFSYIYQVISPATMGAQSLTGSVFKNGFHMTKGYTKKLFDNSDPKIKDAVRTKLSGQKKSVNEPDERILPDEKEELDELIKSHHQ